jgi:putative glutamine amidotransferase
LKPLVGLNLDVNVQKPTDLRIASAYCEAVEKSGGIPVLLPPMSNSSLDSALDHINALVLIGGRDYWPELYGEDQSAPISPLHEIRQRFDMQLAKRALRRKNLPVLGICGGMQLLNIARGGTLWQDIPSQCPGDHVVHRGAEKTAHHAVTLVQDTLLAHTFRATRIESVVSSHHQCVKKLGRGLIVSATADDGIIEAFEMLNRSFVIGVQWHPERGLAENLRLFRALTRAARSTI